MTIKDEVNDNDREERKSYPIVGTQIAFAASTIKAAYKKVTAQGKKRPQKAPMR